MLTVLDPGVASTVQDLGRPGWAHLGVTPGGAADRGALRLADRLVANPEGAAGIEVLVGGLRLRAGRDLLVAVTGGRGPVTVGGRPEPDRALLRVPAGAVLSVGACVAGLRRYVAVRGGIDVPVVLGSRSTDVLAGLGRPPLAAGDELPVGAPPGVWPVTDLAPAAWPALAPGRGADRAAMGSGAGQHPAATAGDRAAGDRAAGPYGDTVAGPDGDTAAGPDGDTAAGAAVVLDAVPGPRDRLAGAAVTAGLTATVWTVDPRSDRVGVRLDGPPLPVDAATAQVPSEAVVRGAVQLPPDGRPVLFGADHPTTGGYPVVAVLTAAAADRAAQLRPGDSVRIRLRPRPAWAG